MMQRSRFHAWRWLIALLPGVFCLYAGFVDAAPIAPIAHSGDAGMLSLSGSASGVIADSKGVSEAVRIATLLTLLSVAPALIVSMTAFIRIAIVLSMIRHAFGMPETPPTPVLISLALFLTAFAMLPTLQVINHDALQPFMHGQIDLAHALDSSTAPIRDFMLRQVREDELRLMYEMSQLALPQTPADVSLLQLTPAFILNELRVAFQIGFVILLPFLLIDLVVSSVLLSLGMLMVPPATISLPLKVLMFVLVDGWSLVLRGVLGSFK
ncbi:MULTISPECIES: flagellar type III secretion system pore protein FliP [unclassified Paraburkholderia]|uniref:flagellar type III secretion system pore protein FliP n=1 Tax=unclassified Paraburkholderia TaxID=2615204 RepID=UPI0017E4408A|nr:MULTISPECIES: flagellar type III secretion system pore protein FliP [unclassified Paraburkholderia]MBB5447951.1 flagellar biosynthetic protein FliP [Paraburkholderia sp. WSM4177]MBB5488366.1 flagellar biosynthetic protein FliP [Paraburkholderia sp. WSM4180]